METIGGEPSRSVATTITRIEYGREVKRMRIRNNQIRRLVAKAVILAASLALVVGGNATAQGDDILTVAHPFSIEMDMFGADQGGRFQLTINRAIFDRLIERDDAQNTIVPGLAESWERTDDTTWVFTLREGVTFHDGSPLTSADVKDTLDYFIEQNGTLAPLLQDVTSIETPDDTTVILTTSIANGTLPSSMTLFSIAPSELLRDPNFSVNPVGSGPFKFVEFVPGTRVELTANEEYWGGAPTIDGLVFEEIPEVAARVTALTTGEIDITWGLPADQVAALSSDPNLTIESVPAFLHTEILINTEREPLDNLLVRQAMAHAINKDAIAEFLLGPTGSIATSVVSASIFGAVPQEPFEYDPELSRELLAEAGYPDGVQTTVLLRPNEAEQQVMLAIISDWAQVGIQVEPVMEEMATWVEDYVGLNWDMAMVFRPTLTGDADYTLRRLYHSEANRAPFANEELDALLDQAGAAATQEERLEYYAQADKMIWDNVWGIFPFDINEIYVYRNDIQGFVAAASTTPDFQNVEIAAE